MIKFAKYDIGDKIMAWSNYMSHEGAWLSVRGQVIEDDGGWQLTIKTDKDSNFPEKEYIS